MSKMIKRLDEMGHHIVKARKLISSKEDIYDLYQYGPFLTMRDNYFFEEFYKEIKNPLLYYFTDMASILKRAMSYRITPCKKMKTEITNIINRSSYRYDRYADLVSKHGNQILTNIIEIQKKNHVMESAMLNYAPIVPYCGTIVKSEMLDLHQRDFVDLNDLYQTRSIMDQTIEDCLRDHIVEIMTNNHRYVITSNDDLINTLQHYNRIEDEKEKEVLRWVLNYRIAVFVKFKAKSNPKATFNILNDCNIIHNGGRINVAEVVERFSEEE